MEKGVPWSKLLNRDRRILLNLRLLIEKRVLMILAKAVLKNTDPSIFYEHFKRSPKSDHIHRDWPQCGCRCGCECGYKEKKHSHAHRPLENSKSMGI